MSKIIKLYNNASYYYERALDRSDNEDFLGCLKLLRQAQRLVETPYGDEDLAIRLEVADTLGLMGLYTESNRLYFRLTAFEFCLSDVYYGIVKNYAMMDMREEAAHYLNYAMEQGHLSADDGFEPIDYEILRNSGKGYLRLVKSDDKTQTIRLAKQLLGSADTEFARQILETVPESSDQFIEAANYRALIEISNGNYSEGIRLCEKVLQKNERDIYALTTKILAFSMSGQTVERDRAVAELDAMRITSWPDAAKVALCYCQIGNSSLAFRQLSYCLESLPYDRDILLLYALAASNEGKFQQAKHAFVQLQLIYPEDSVVRYYAREMDIASGEKTTFELIPDFSLSQCDLYARQLDAAFETAKTPERLWQMMLSDTSLFDVVRWGLYSGNYGLQIRLGKFLAKAELAYILLREILVDPEYPVIPKKEIFAEILRAGKVRMVQVVVGNEIRWYCPSIPKEIRNQAFAAAYWQVYSALAFIADGFDRKLNTCYRKLHELSRVAGNTAGLKENVIAAALAYKSRINKIFSSKAAVCEVFGCPAEELSAFLSRTEPTKKSAGKRRKEDAT